MGKAITHTRVLDGEHVIGEDDRLMSRDQVLLAASTTFTKPGTILGQVTATKQFVPVNRAATDGSQKAVAILWAGRAASTGTRRAVVHSRRCRVNGKKLTYPAGADQAAVAAINAELAEATIQVGY